MPSLERCAGAVLAVLLLLGAGCGSDAPDPSHARAAGRFPSPAPVARATVWAVGDGANGSAPAKRVASLIARGRPARFLYLGDVYPAGTAIDFKQNYRPVYGRLAARTLPTPGNHEWALHRSGYDPYWSRVTGGRPPSFYTVTLAGWTLLSLNSEEPMDPGSRQGRWLAGQAGPGTCRLAFWHRPRFSAGLHGDQTDVAGLWDPLRGHAALVLNGHDHDMQQLRPRDGITELIAGSGGNGHYPVRRGDRRLAWSNDAAYGAIRIRLQPGRASFAFVSASGRVLRSGTVACQPA
jgi:hypothetical protein